MSDFAVKTEQLTKRYGSREAVSSLDLVVARGALCGVLGPNGSGKTTTIRMLLGLVKPTSGRAWVLDHEVSERRAVCEQVGCIIETPAFYPYLSARRNLEVFAACASREVPRSRIGALLERVGLGAIGEEKVGTFSLGMKQRLGLAATLLTDPAVLFLDEPTNGLDPAGIIEMRELLLALRAEGKTVLISSHQLGEIERVCTDVLLLHKGRTRLAGPMASFLESGKRVVLRVTPLARALEVAAKEPRLEAAEENGALVVSADDAELARLVRALVSAELDVIGVERRGASLEQRFLELTGAAS